MLKISRTDDAATSTQPTLKLEGQVRGRWVEELRRVCVEVLASPHDRLTLDLADVSFIDGAGLALFEELAERKVGITNCSMFAAEQLKGAANGRQ
jgi:ABC-type transporter Mla MlaB component